MREERHAFHFPFAIAHSFLCTIPRTIQRCHETPGDVRRTIMALDCHNLCDLLAQRQLAPQVSMQLRGHC
jgi:hypothetical protein